MVIIDQGSDKSENPRKSGKGYTHEYLERANIEQNSATPQNKKLGDFPTLSQHLSQLRHGAKLGLT